MARGGPRTRRPRRRRRLCPRKASVQGKRVQRTRQDLSDAWNAGKHREAQHAKGQSWPPCEDWRCLLEVLVRPVRRRPLLSPPSPSPHPPAPPPSLPPPPLPTSPAVNVVARTVSWKPFSLARRKELGAVAARAGDFTIVLRGRLVQAHCSCTTRFEANVALRPPSGGV